jgi:hypothetical protein
MGRKKKEIVEMPVVIDRSKLDLVHTPGGGMKNTIKVVPDKCESLDDIPNWMERCQVYGENHGMVYSHRAFRYMARQIWEGNELDEALKRIPKDDEVPGRL